MEYRGWIKLHRKILSNPLWQSTEKFDKRSAWIDLLLLANHEDREILFQEKDGYQKVKRGQVLTSIVHMAERWKWDRKTVRRYLDTLEKAGMVTQKRTAHGTTITIENYSVYQNDRTSTGTSTGTQTRSKEYKEYKECKEDKNDKNDKNPLSFLSNPDLKKVIQAYEETGMQISTTTASDFADLIGRYSADWVIEAIKAANRAGRDHVRVNYITGILRNWEERGGIDDGRSGKHSEHAEAEERINRQLAGDIF